MLITAGISALRVIRHSGELPAMKNSATSGFVDPRHVQSRTRGVHERVQVLVLNRAQMHELGALVAAQAPIDDVRAAVDHDLVAAVAQARGKLLDRSLEPAIGGGDSPGAKDRDLHAASARE